MIRFKHEDGSSYQDWRKISFGEVFNSLEYGMNAAAITYDGENKYIRITDIDEDTRRYSTDDIVSPQGKLDEKYLLKEGDIVFARTGASVGKTYCYDKKDGTLYFAGFLIKGSTKKDFDARCIFAQTLTEKYNKWVKKASMRSGQPGINATEYASYEFLLPIDIEEQQKIATFLSNVDEVIQESEKEVQLLKELKKGAMQKIFSQEVRFKDANGNEYQTWKEKTLEQLFEYKNGDSFENSIDGNGRYYLISLNSIDRYGNLKKDLKKVNHANWFLQKDDIVMVLSDVGKGDFLGLCDIIPNDEYVLNQRMGLLRKKEEVVVLYIRNYINHNQPFFKRQGQGSAQLNISKGDVLKFVVKLPCLEEQQKIADFLSDFDTAIEEAKKELEYWKQLKKGLLQQMFM